MPTVMGNARFQLPLTKPLNYVYRTEPGKSASIWTRLGLRSKIHRKIHRNVATNSSQTASLEERLAKISAFVSDWTPFGLVASYFTFSTCLYMICSENLISIFWFIYLMTNFYIAGSTVIEAFMSIAPCRDAREAVTKAQRSNWVFPTPDEDILFLDLVIVAYLPNEKDIIIDRINYACEKIIYPKHKIRINIVYNTPQTMEPLETEMMGLMQQFSHLRIHKVPNSTSKADNLNYFFRLDTGADVVAIYDSDHYAHPYGPRWAIERFMTDKKIDIVQGRCVVFNSRASLLSAIISVEFDKIYAVSHPGRATLWGFGLFTGSNGYWRAPLLKTLKMDGDMLTEDIDSSLRAFSKGCKAVHDLNVVSYELAPTNLRSFWRQRLRWAQGWAQASMKHVRHTWNKPQESPRSFTNRFGLLSLLVIREASYYLVTQYCCLVFSLICLHFPTSGTAFFRIIFFTYPVSQWFFIISFLSLLGTLVITNRAKSEFATPWMIIMFSVLYPAYLVLTAVIGLYGHARQVSRYSNWNPTART